jgi:putative hydrolase of the HAD superfamily
MSHDAVVLDLDDTLYPYSPCNEAGKEAAHRRAQELGYELDHETFLELYQQARAAIKQDIDGTGSSHERHIYFKKALDLHTGTVQAADALELGDAFWDAYMDQMELFTGVIETLEWLREEDTKRAVSTDLTTRTQLRKIERLGIEEYIDVLVTSEELGRDKPATAMFAVPLGRLGVTPEEAVMIGDSLTSDIAGGNSLGMTTVLFNSDDDPTSPVEEPDHRIESFAELKDIVTGERS